MKDSINLLTQEQYIEFKKLIITNMHYELCNKLVRVSKPKVGNLMSDVPEVLSMLEKIKLFEEEFGEYINKI